MGITSSKLEELKYYIVIKAKDTKTNQIYNYFTVASTFDISLYYRDSEIQVSNSTILTLTAGKFF